jgi:putative oxidoreductase
MFTAIRKVHWKNGIWNTQGGFEFNAVLIAVVTALATDGPGRFSVDAAFGKSRWGVLGGLFALGAGVAGSFAAIELGRRAAVAQRADEPEATGEPTAADASASTGDASASTGDASSSTGDAHGGA